MNDFKTEEDVPKYGKKTIIQRGSAHPTAALYH